MSEKSAAKSCWSQRGERRHGLGAAVAGLALLGLGAVLTLDNLGVVPAGRLLPYWPVLLILLGACRLLEPPPERHLISGLLWVVVGGALLLVNLGVLPLTLGQVWPLALVAVGLGVIGRAIQCAVTTRDDEEVNHG